MMKKIFALTLTGILVLASALLLTNLATFDAFAFQGPPQMGQGGPGGPGGGPGFHGRGGPRGMLSPRMFERLADRLGLSEQQLDQIEALFDTHRQAVEPTREELHDLHQQIRELTKDGGFFENEAEVTDLAQAAAQLQATLEVERARLRAEIYQVLTPEQRDQLQSMKGRFGGRRGGFGK